MSKIAVVGRKDTILIFKSLCMDVYFTGDDDAKQVLEKVIGQGYSIVLATEREYVLAAELIDTFADKPYPIIMPIPDGVAGLGLGANRIADNYKKAIGGGT